jgi:spermidine/putrescine-binding protein
MKRLDRREFLVGSAALGGAGLLAGCGSSSGLKAAASSAASTGPPVSYPGTIGAEPNHLVIAEWPGYEAGGTKAQTYGLKAGTGYTRRFGAIGLTYADYGNDDKNLNKMRAGERFDLLHPCVDYVQDYVDAGLVEPFDTTLLPTFPQLYPQFTDRGSLNGQQFWIPWDWGFGSIMYRKDKVSAPDATGWDLMWNEKYSGKISMWDGGSTPVMVAGLVTDPPAKDIFAQTSAELDRSKQQLIAQKPLNKFYWTSEYGDMQPAFKAGGLQCDGRCARLRQGRVHESVPGQAGLGVRIHDGQGHQEPSACTRIRRVVHQPRRLGRPGQPVRLRVEQLECERGHGQ